MFLHIDTTDRNQITVKLTNDQAEEVAVMSQMATQGGHSQLLIALIDDLLQHHQLSASRLTGVYVNCGPGSFTGTRVGVAMANGLGLALNISVNDLPVGQAASVLYASAPNISQPVSKKA